MVLKKKSRSLGTNLKWVSNRRSNPARSVSIKLLKKVGAREFGGLFDNQDWELRLGRESIKKIYAVILCADEHEEFVESIRKMARTIDALSGNCCDVFFLDKPRKRYPKSAASTKMENRVGRVDRSLCHAIRLQLFGEDRRITLPGLAFFASPTTKGARFYGFSGWNAEKISKEIQDIFFSLRQASAKGNASFSVFKEFKRLERNRKLKEAGINKVAATTLADLIALGGALGLLTAGS